MINKNSIKRYIRQIIAITKKNVFLDLRYKANVFTRFLNPVIQLLILIYLFGALFNIREGYSIGYWNANNFVLFLLLAFCFQQSRPIINKYQALFMREKYWKTLSAMMVAPVNRFTLLVSVLISELVILAIPLLIVFIITYILYPISIVYIILILLMFFALVITYASIGLLLGTFSISHEDLVPYLTIVIRFAFLFSCTNFPVQVFPKFIQDIVLLNPLYYFFDLLRLIWYLGIDYNTAVKFITPYHIISIVVITISFPILSVIIFDKVYKKYGITGY